MDKTEKKRKKKLYKAERKFWEISPVTRIKENKKKKAPRYKERLLDT